MIENSLNSSTQMDGSQPRVTDREEFAREGTRTLDGQREEGKGGEPAFEEDVFDQMAAEFYGLASILVGEGEDSIRVMETAVANSEVSMCTEPEEAHRSGRRALAIAAIERVAERDPHALTAPLGIVAAQTCIDDDDLDAAGVSRVELERMMAGPDRERVRTWLESLPTALRVIFGLRAVAGFCAAETSGLLAEYGGPAAAGWSTEAVRELFRQGLCSVASQLIHAGVEGRA